MIDQITANRPATILVVDDEVAVRDLISRWITNAGYQCVTARDANEAWQRLQECHVDLATLDVNMPGQSGIELLHRVVPAFPETGVFMLTAASGSIIAIKALMQGAWGYLIKPVERDELLFHVKSGLERRELIIERRQYTECLEIRVREQTQSIRRAQEEIIHRLIAASSFRDEETGAHIKRTGLLSEFLAKAAGWDDMQAELLRMAAPMHDIGKIGIPDSILRKPGKLTSQEIEIMRTHASIGARMLANSESPALRMAQQIALCHHERWDGRGYPDGLAGEAIPECARIVAIVDMYDAITHDRVYRPAFSGPETLGMMLDGSGSHFDPRLLEIFVSLLPEIRRIAEQHLDDPTGTLSQGEITAIPKVLCEMRL